MSRSLTSPLRIAIIGLVVAGAAIGCGGDDDSSSGNGAATNTAAPADDSDADASGNPDVEQFCRDAEALAEELAEVIADPTSGDLAALQQRVTDLTASATQLTSATPDDTARINECTQAMTDALTG